MAYLQANDQLQARLEALRSQPSALVQAQAKQEEHVRDRDKFRTLIDNLQVDHALFIPASSAAFGMSSLCCTTLLPNAALHKVTNAALHK